MSDLAPHQLVNQSSGNTEIYSPPDIVAGWHAVLGEIDLDPASSEIANQIIRARTIYTEPAFDVVGEMECAHTLEPLPIRSYVDWGGLSWEWHGRTVLNPPFGSPENFCQPNCSKKGCIKRGWHTATDLPGMNHWVNHFVGEHEAERLTEGIFLCFAATSEGWFQPLMRYPQCYPKKRTNYYLPDGTLYKGVTKGSCLTYVGPNVARFAEVFESMGTIKVPYVSCRREKRAKGEAA